MTTTSKIRMLAQKNDVKVWTTKAYDCESKYVGKNICLRGDLKNINAIIRQTQGWHSTQCNGYVELSRW